MSYNVVSVVASQICETPQNSPKIRTYSKQFKVIDFGANRKRMRLPISD